MDRLSMQRTAARALAIAAALGCGAGNAREGDGKQNIVALPLRLSMEWTELFNPGAPSRLVTEGFALGGGTKSLRLQYSTRAPAALGGMQFQWLPAGYRLAEFTASGKLGSVGAFRSTGYNTALERSGFRRPVAGAGVELARALFGFRLKGSAVRSSPGEGGANLGSGLRRGEAATQIDLASGREWNGGARLRMEWSRSVISPGPPGQGGPGVRKAQSGDAWMVRFEGAPLRSEVAFALTDRDGGFVNAALPTLAPGGGNLRADLGRKVRGQTFRYSARSDWLHPPHAQGAPGLRAREDTVGWSWSRAPLPRIEASYYRKRRAAAGTRESEGGLRLSLSRAFGGLRAAGLYVRARRADLLSQRTLWDRRALSGELVFEMRAGRRLDVRYEANDLMPAGSPAALRTRILKADAFLEAWDKRISLAPVIELVGQRGGRAATALRATLGVRIVPPHWFPGADWMIRLAASRTASAAYSARTFTDLAFRWSFRR